MKKEKKTQDPIFASCMIRRSTYRVDIHEVSRLVTDLLLGLNSDSLSSIEISSLSSTTCFLTVERYE